MTQCIDCSRLSLKTKDGKPHAMVKHGAGICEARPTVLSTMQKVFATSVGLTAERECPEFQPIADPAPRRAWWAKQKTKETA